MSEGDCVDNIYAHMRVVIDIMFTMLHDYLGHTLCMLNVMPRTTHI